MSGAEPDTGPAGYSAVGGKRQSSCRPPELVVMTHDAREVVMSFAYPGAGGDDAGPSFFVGSVVPARRAPAVCAPSMGRERPKSGATHQARHPEKFPGRSCPG